MRIGSRLSIRSASSIGQSKFAALPDDTGANTLPSEEGARFPMSMCASGVWAGETSLEAAYNLKEVGGGTATMKSELERIGYLGSTPASYKAMPMGAHFELHIEQGPILEAEKRKVGIVKGVQAYKWFTIEVSGRGMHNPSLLDSARLTPSQTHTRAPRL